MKLIVEFEWDGEESGPAWFNMDNLELCLFSKECTKRELLEIRELNVKEAIEKLMNEIKERQATPFNQGKISSLNKLLKELNLEVKENDTTTKIQS